VEAKTSTPVNEQTIIYLNRLSDLLFVLARWANRQAGVREDTWTAPKDKENGPVSDPEGESEG
jgi:cob(I)alamin adenosyltransferase